MKKVFALLLCIALLLALPVGCKKKDENAKAELTTSIISSDLINQRSEYSFDNCGTVSSMANVEIVEKTEKDNTTVVSVTARALSACVSIDLAADMTYIYENGGWKLTDINVTKKVPTPIAAPDMEMVSVAIDNYITNNQTSLSQQKNIALAIKGEVRHNLEIDFRKLTREMKYDEKTKTAKLHVSQKTDTLTFSGYYSLTFDETKGWIIDSQKQSNGQNYLVLYLDTLEQNAPTTDKK